ncbi:hypothetical protein [Priestia flexa]|uniref:hypothetical protein n=1 Tax=Priestia flexa TaxID=86664 RepID=UPI00099D9055|nr:hypothetical protein [Priestia flexa]AQX56661.1 hypothetical protein BC359_20875 [Priestia flexa]AQX56672.1 hypothetical protein BC359_20935 [Priestia flexa]
MKGRSFVSFLITTLVVGFLLLLSDTFNQRIDVPISELFSIGSLLFIIGLGGLLYILLIPSYGLIESKFKNLNFSLKLLAYSLIGLIISPIITSILERHFSINMHTTITLIGAFILFAILSKKNLKPR